MKKRIDMKRIYAAIVFLMCSASLTAMSGCSGDEGPAGPEPPVIEDYVITPINGGGIATFNPWNKKRTIAIMIVIATKFLRETISILPRFLPLALDCYIRNQLQNCTDCLRSAVHDNK